jgi:hypothetical protein
MAEEYKESELPDSKEVDESNLPIPLATSRDKEADHGMRKWSFASDDPKVVVDSGSSAPLRPAGPLVVAPLWLAPPTATKRPRICLE